MALKKLSPKKLSPSKRSTAIFVLEGNQVTVNKTRNTFTCVCERKTYTDHVHLLAHMKTCKAITVPSLTDDEAKKRKFKELMSTLNWKKLGSFGVICGQCKNIIKGNYRNHSLVHGVFMDKGTEAMMKYGLKAFCKPDEVSPTAVEAGQTEILDGRRCSACDFCAVGHDHMRKHIREKHANSATSSLCKVAKVGLGETKKYVWVQDPSAPSSPQAIPESVLKATLGRVEHPQSTDAVGNMFFRLGVIMSREQAGPLMEYEVEDPQFDRRTQFLESTFKTWISNVNTHHAIYRGVFDKSKLFKTVERVETSSRYVKYWVRLMRFLKFIVGKEELPGLKDRVDILFDSPSEPNLLRVLDCLVEEKVCTHVRRYSLCEKFLAASLYKSASVSGKVLTVETVSQRAAQLVYLLKTVMLQLLANAYVTQADNERKMADYQKMFDSPNLSSAWAIIVVLSQAVEMRDEMEREAIIVEGPNGTVTINGVLFSVELARRVKKSLVESTGSAMEKLCFGKRFSFDPDRIVDDVKCADNGYKFGFDTVDLNDRADLHLLRAVTEDPQLLSRFVSEVRDGRIAFDRANCVAYLKDYDIFRRELHTLVHWTSGMPARATELVTNVVRNCGDNVRRTVFFDKANKMVFLAPLYNKTNSVRHANQRIFRFLPVDVSKVVLLDLLVLRPFVVAMLRQWDIEAADDVDNFFFTNSKGRLSDAAVTRQFSKVVNEVTRVPLLFSEFRHFVKFVVNRFIGGSPVEDDDNHEDEGMCRQFGHSSQVSRRAYGLTSAESSSMRRFDVEKFLHFSKRWHKYLESSSLYLQDVVQEETNADVTLNHKPRPDQSTLVTAELPDPVLRVRRFAPIGVGLSDTTAASKLLKKLVGRESAEFSCWEQAYGVECALFTARDMFVNLPTGCGKSLLFFLYALHHQSKAVLVVVPTVSLQVDLVRRSLSFGTNAVDNCDDWARGTILFATPELIDTTRFHQALSGLVSREAVGRVFVDEAHYYYLQRDFRESCKKLGLLRLGGQPVTFLSATMSPSCFEYLASLFFCELDETVVLRKPPVLFNHSYRVERYTDNFSVVLIAVKQEFDLMSVGKVIVFVRSKDLCRALADRMKSSVAETFLLVGGLDVDAVRAVTDAFVAAPKAIMFATSCFGLGVDVPNVRAVLVLDLPFEFESLVQMFGRAGRDGGPAKCVLYINAGKEKTMVASMVRRREPAMKVTAIKDMLTAFDGAPLCRRQVMAEYIDGHGRSCLHLGQACSRCDVCVGDLEAHRDVMMANQMKNPLALMFGLERRRGLSFGLNVLYAVDSLRDACCFCSVARKEVVRHAAEDSCDADKLCWKCFGRDHFHKDCRLKDPKDCGLKEICVRCLLPNMVGEVVFHRGDYTESCASNVALGIAMASKALNDCHIEKTIEQFYYWLLEKDGDYLNAIKFLVDWFDKNGEQ